MKAPGLRDPRAAAAQQHGTGGVMPINDVFDISCPGAEHAPATSTLERVRTFARLTTSGDFAGRSMETWT
jgi:hypothetical protein